jgi:DNA invertase Pin-like site-specific DNA recombinase
MGRFFLTVRAGAAEPERNQIRERTSMAMQHKAERGEYTGGQAPYGYALGEDGALREVEAEQNVIARVLAARARGVSLRAIVAEHRQRACPAARPPERRSRAEDGPAAEPHRGRHALW